METIEKIWHGLGILIVLGIVTLLITLFFANKKVDGYYMGGSSYPAVCVYAHWQWHTDEVAYCTYRYQDVLDFTIKANTTVIK